MAEQTSVADKIAKLEAKLEDRLVEKKLDFNADDSEIDEIFAFGVEDLGKLPPQKLAEYSFILSRYNVYLAKELNKERSARNWARRSLDYIVLPVLSNYRINGSYMSNDEVRMIAIKDNDVAIKFHAYFAEKDQNVDLLSDLSYDIRKMADSLNEISKSKRYNNG